MEQAAAGILKIVIFLVIGVFFRNTGILKDREMAGIKKIILYVAIPAVLFLSFSRLNFNLSFIPITAVVFSINFILFWIGVLLFKLTGSKNRLLPLFLSTMNFGLIGIPLYEAVFGLEYLHHYTVLGIGNEIFVWFVFNFMFRWFLSRGQAGKGINTGFIKSPIVWSIILGCLFSILNLDISQSSNFIIRGIYTAVDGASGITTPLILIFIGYNISITTAYLKRSVILFLQRLTAALAVGYLLKYIVLDKVIEGSGYYDSAFFLLITLPPIFALPILAADYLDNDESVLLNNTIVIHALITIIMFSLFVFFTAV